MCDLKLRVESRVTPKYLVSLVQGIFSLKSLTGLGLGFKNGELKKKKKKKKIKTQKSTITLFSRPRSHLRGSVSPVLSFI
jgi:hypothetical protein